MRVGSIVFATEQGLGYLAKDFFKHGVITDPIILAHGRRQDHLDWYPAGTPYITNHRLPEALRIIHDRLLRCDAFLAFETPFIWELFSSLKGRVRTALMPMHECMPEPLPYHPDVIINPSHLDQDCYPQGVRIPVPVPDGIEWRRRERARTFVHNAGHGGLRGRNGTAEVIEAWRYTKSDANLLIRAQDPEVVRQVLDLPRKRLERVTCYPHSVPWDQLYEDGDVFLFPEKFNGLSLPLQEAYASGMLIMATDRHPMNKWLPPEPLIPPKGYCKSSVRSGWRLFDEAIIHPLDVAELVDTWYDKEIADYSEGGRRWAESMTWDRLRPRYLEVLKG